MTRIVLSISTSLTIAAPGHVIRIGPNTVDFDTATAMAKIHKDRNANVRKAPWYKTIDAESGAQSVQSVIDHKEHDFRRRIMSSAFSDSALRDQEQFIDNNVRVFLHEMGKNVQDDGWTAPRDFSEWITYFGFDFISDLAFGSCLRLLQDPENRYLPNLLKWASHFLYYVSSSSTSLISSVISVPQQLSNRETCRPDISRLLQSCDS